MNMSERITFSESHRCRENGTWSESWLGRCHARDGKERRDALTGDDDSEGCPCMLIGAMFSEEEPMTCEDIWNRISNPNAHVCSDMHVCAQVCT
jgi:hypothetical protein